MNIILYTIFFAIYVTNIFGQISGTISDSSSGIPIQHVNVTVGKKGTTTNSVGNFFLDVPLGTTIEFSHIGYKNITTIAKDSMLIGMAQKIIESDEIIVKAGLVNEKLKNISSSISIITNKDIREYEADNFQNILNKIPNLNWTGGTSRPRYFQIRGIGERSHYFGEGPPNFSIGYVVDDIDLSGMGMVGQLFDVKQVEIFRGPQSSIYGPNAIAGLISIYSRDPSTKPEFKSALQVGSDNQLGLSASFSNMITQSLSFRMSSIFQRNDGFRKNNSRNITDTNSKEEILMRFKLKFTPSNKISILNTFLVSNMNNRYDVWAPDNNTSFETFTDDIGEDSQNTYGLSINGEFKLNNKAKIKSIVSITSTKAVHAYDADWGDSLYWASMYDWTPGFMGESYYPIRDFYQNEKNRKNISQEVRLYLNSFILGIYNKDLEEKQKANGYLYASEATDGTSDYDFNASAAYFQYNYPLTDNIFIKSNFRYESNEYSYLGDTYLQDSVLNPVIYNIKDHMMGYKAAITYKVSNNTNYFISLSTGYKAGGINQQPNLIESSRPYGPEYANNFELGLKFNKQDKISYITIFHTKRIDQQISVSDQVDKTEPNSFLFYTSNAGSGSAMGIELEHSYQLSHKIKLFSSFGILDSWVDKFTYQSTDWEGNIIEEYGGNREAAMAPRIMGSLGASLNIYDVLVNTNTSFKSEYYFSDSHNKKSNPFSLTDIKIKKKFGKVSLQFWIHNVFDKRYPIRGFYFGLIPPNYPDQLWITHGDPRQIGITVNYNI